MSHARDESKVCVFKVPFWAIENHESGRTRHFAIFVENRIHIGVSLRIKGTFEPWLLDVAACQTRWVHSALE
jgi:hypothetical protein